MTTTLKISEAALETLFATLGDAGQSIVGPAEVDGRIEFKPVRTLSEVAGDAIQPVLSAKEAAFPRIERSLSYRMAPGKVELQDADPEVQPPVLFGLRPCEAAGFHSLDAVFNWDTRDKFFNARREQMTIVSMSCTQAEDACFCTAVGGGSGSTKGSDILLTPLQEGGYLAEILTEKGEALKDLAPVLFQPANGEDKGALLAKVEANFDHQAIAAKLPGLFTSDLWTEQSLRFIGCVACAFVCPTCVCFAI